MNKKILGLLTIVTAIMFSLTFTSCNNDDVEETIEAGTNKLEAKMFIGTWSGYGTWTFNEDGTCEYSYNSSYSGHWSYNSETKTLITDVLNWNWQILNITENSWTGTHLAGKGTTTTFTRVK